MILGQHGMLDPAGMGLIAVLIGLIVSALAIFGINRARAPTVLTFWLGVALVGVAVVICGTGIVVASE